MPGSIWSFRSPQRLSVRKHATQWLEAHAAHCNCQINTQSSPAEPHTGPESLCSALQALMEGSPSARYAHLLPLIIAGRRLGCVVIGACSEGVLR